MSKIVFASIVSLIICLISCKKDDTSLLPSSAQSTKKDSVIINTQDLNLDKITLSIKGKLVDCNEKSIEFGGVSYAIIYKNGVQTFPSIAKANKDGSFEFNIYFNKNSCFCDSYLDKIRIIAFDIKGEREGIEQFIPLKINTNDIGVIKVCNPLSEYIKVKTGNGKTALFPFPGLSICQDSLSLIGSSGMLEHIMISTANMSLPLKAGIYDGYTTARIADEQLQEHAYPFRLNSKVTYSKMANKIGDFYEGNYEGNLFNGGQKTECKGLFRYRKRF